MPVVDSLYSRRVHLAVPPSDPRQSASDESPQVIGAIPARYGSTRIPGKPLRSLAGKPLVEHVYRQARKAKALSRVVVLTDDERIGAAVDGCGVHASGMCPSPANRPDVGSSPIHPAPGT